MQIARVGAVLFSLSLLACGDDGGTKLIDSGIGNTDAAPKVCSEVTIGSNLDVSGENLGTFMSFSADLNEQVAGAPAAFFLELYHSVTPSITGTIDLSLPPNDDFATCGVCLYAASGTSAQDVKYFFQQSGTITFTEDPITARHLTATITGLKMQEASIDGMTLESTFNPTGDCASITSGAMDTDNLPNDWDTTTCMASDYYSGATGDCNCQCGVYDPDCRRVGATVTNCTAGQACWPDESAGTLCVAKPANDTCASATTLLVGVPQTSTTIGADRNYNMGLQEATCTKYRQPGPDVAYSVTLTEGMSYTFLLSALDAEFDGSISLVGPGPVGTEATVCSDMITTCKAGYDEGYGGDDETFSYTVPTGGTGTYFVIVDSYNSDDGGAYTVGFTSP